MRIHWYPVKGLTRPWLSDLLPCFWTHWAIFHHYLNFFGSHKNLEICKGYSLWKNLLIKMCCPQFGLIMHRSAQLVKKPSPCQCQGPWSSSGAAGGSRTWWAGCGWPQHPGHAQRWDWACWTGLVKIFDCLEMVKYQKWPSLPPNSPAPGDVWVAQSFLTQVLQ